MKSKSLVPVLFLFFVSPLLHVHAAEIATTRSMSPMLGQGYLNERQGFMGECLQGTEVYEGMPEASVAYSSSISEQELASELGIAAGGKARLGLTTVSAAAAFYKSSQSDAFSVSAIYTGSYFFKNRIFKDPQLKPVFASYVQNLSADKWRESCGDEFVVQQQLGAKLFFSIRVDFTNEEERNAFAAVFDLSAPLFSVNASVGYGMENLSKNTRVTINVLQIGGKVNRVTEIFKAHQQDGAPESASNAFRFVQCSSGKMAECQKVLEQAINYATDTNNGFPSQISPNGSSESGTDGGPAVLSSTTQSYRVANVFFDVTPELNLQMKLSRQLISQKYEDAYKQYSRTKRLVRDGVVRLSPRQREVFLSMETNLFVGLQKITEASLKCYQEPKTCGVMYADLSESLPEGVKLYSDSDFVVEPETFAQLCDLGDSPLSQMPLANTIAAMVKYAQTIEPDFFLSPFKDATKDNCNAAQTVLTRASKLVLDGLAIQDLRPLQVLSHLTELSLRNTGLKNVDGLAKLKNLEILDLTSNLLTNVDALASLRRLRELTLTDNRISDVSSLATSQLAKLDLRNNEAGIACPFESKQRCVIADFRTNNSFINIRKDTTIPRFAHASAKLSGNRILVIGGRAEGMNSAIRAEIFDLHTGTFHFIGEMVRPRYYHTATGLLDGNVLIVGGFGKSASKTAEVFKVENESFFPTQSGLHIPRAIHTATRLLDGRVLIAGGFSNDVGFYRGGDATVTTEIYDPNTSQFVMGPSMTMPRGGHTATLLNDGTVLVIGGEGNGHGLTTAEIFYPNENVWRSVLAPMRTGRSEHSATLLNDGRVLLAGGFDGNVATNRAEIFDPASMLFEEAGSLGAARAEHEAQLLSDGRVVLLGGRSAQALVADTEAMEIPGALATAEIFDPATKLFTQSPHKMSAARTIFTATMTKENQFLIVGGLGGLSQYSAELFTYTP